MRLNFFEYLSIFGQMAKVLKIREDKAKVSVFRADNINKSE